MTAQPQVSVLMAVYNAGQYLNYALQSLLNQTLMDLEVLAVDDASTDGSLAILERTAQADPRLRVFRQSENQGQAVARNVALRHARGEFVCMVDADDWLSPDALERGVEVFRRYPLTDSVVFRLMEYWQDTGAERPYPTPQFTSLTGEEAFRLSLDWTLHGLYLIRREIHLRYPYDDSYRLYSDDNTTRLHYLHSREVRPCAGIYYYRKHAESTTMAVSPLRFLYMWANLSMRRTLEQEHVAPAVMALYDRHRWHNYLSQLWLFWDNCTHFSAAERTRLRQDFRKVYATFCRPWPYLFFLASQRLRWRLRRTLQRLHLSA
ncbi:MAG: glycosyltransferase family 2 protein [Bacteroidaceae bacterium]|nr:glycosyltransferase family 2 protein [Bacteroidaceae bacterium]